MAETSAFGGEMPSGRISPLLLRIRSEYFSRTNNVNDLEVIGKYFRELQTHCEALDSKYHHRKAAFGDVECYLNALRAMVVRLLKKIYNKIVKRLRETPSTVNPWRGLFTTDVPCEIFNVLLKKIIIRNGFCTKVKETNVITEIHVTDIRKVVHIFDRQNMDGKIMSKSQIGCKQVEKSELKITKLVVSQDKPFVFKYNKNMETLTVSFHYGHWNQSGLPQH